MSCDCKGSGINIVNGETKLCKCMIRDEIHNYCKEFSKFVFNPKYSSKQLHRDLIFCGMDYNSFGSITKSFLAYLYLKGKYTWRAISGMDLVDINFGDDELHYRNDVVDLGFLILKLGRDSKNKLLGDWLIGLISARKERDKLTWIYTYNTQPAKIVDTYGQDFNRYISDKNEFKILRLQ